MVSDWEEKAECRGTPVGDLFFDEEKIIRLDMAESFCSRCPVAYECLSGALERKERFGTWGGVDQDDLREVQHIDGFGRASSIKINEVTCVNCKTVIPLSETVSQDVECPKCKLQWRMEFK